MSSAIAVRARRIVAGALDRIPAPAPRALSPVPAGRAGRTVMGRPGLPLLGETVPFMADSIGFCEAARRRFGNVFWTSVIGSPMVVVLGGEGIGTVLSGRDGAYSSRLGWGYFIGPFFRRGVMLMDGAEHRHHRLIMQQAFTRPRLRGYLERMHPAIGRGLGRWPTRGELHVYTALKQLTLNIATEVFMGAAPGAEADGIDRAFIDVVAGGQALIRADTPIPWAKWHRGLAGRRVLEQYFRGQVAGHREGDAEDLFSVLCRAESETGDRFSDEDVVNHMIFGLMAAHDTSTITLAMMIYHLARDPAWQDRVYAESAALGTETPSDAELESLTAMDLVFRETLRINPPVSMIARRSLVDTEIDGHFVPGGSLLMLEVYPTHHMEPWWPDPARFDPERFTPERRGEPGPATAWFPFGSHAHKCIGMHFGGLEVKAILHRLLLSRRLRIPAGYAPPLTFGTGAYPADGLPITFEPRS